MILLTDRLGEVLPTIRSRCQLVRFEPPSADQLASELTTLGIESDTADALVALALQDAEQARELAGAEGRALRAAAQAFARAALAERMASQRPWNELLVAVRARGEAAAAELEAQAEAELELTARKERARLKTEWSERGRRARRRAQTAALDLALQLVTLVVFRSRPAWPGMPRTWSATAIGASSSARTRPPEGGSDPARLRAAIELVEDTRLRFALNVSEDLACEALAYRLESVLNP